MYLEKCDLTGKTALVTGGGRGIGLACCRALAEAGGKVIIADLDPKVAATGQAAASAAAGASILNSVKIERPVTPVTQPGTRFSFSGSR